jgi:hypothetical protein
VRSGRAVRTQNRSRFSPEWGKKRLGAYVTFLAFKFGVLLSGAYCMPEGK